VPELARHVTPLNFEDHADRLKEADWIVEVVVERMDVKKKVYAWVAAAPPRGIDRVVEHVGLSLREMAAAMPDEMRRRFLVTHFFNPVRYMRLLEIVGHDDLDPDALATIVDFAERQTRQGRRVREGHAELHREPDRDLRARERVPPHERDDGRAGRRRLRTRRWAAQVRGVPHDRSRRARRARAHLRHRPRGCPQDEERERSSCPTR
jgi:hypothetical protein